MSRIVLAMSGGVDSSVAAAMLCQEGHEVIGVFMRHGSESPVATCKTENSQSQANDPELPIIGASHKQGCCTAADAEDARRVSDRLDIPFYALNLQQEFSAIVDYFIDEYTVGRTPNPCVMCNNWIKFGKLFDYADSIDAEYVATGHYARLRSSDSGRMALLRGNDSHKDQSYVLFGISENLLPRMMLPIGEFTKTEIRSRAKELGILVAEKKDSQEICFVPSGKHDQFIRKIRSDQATAGEIVTTHGDVVGKHAGIEGFTIGQRKGLGIAFGEPRYVVRIDAESRQVVLGTKEELACRALTASQTNWLVDPPEHPLRCEVQIRYNSGSVPAVVSIPEEGKLQIEFDEPCYGVAPGQAVVCYDGPRVLGGGWIDN